MQIAVGSSRQGFSFDYVVAGGVVTPLPASWTMMLVGLGLLGLLGSWGSGRTALPPPDQNI
jgi:PEP-CTERM motif